MSCWHISIHFCGLRSSDAWHWDPESKIWAKTSSLQKLLYLSHKVNLKAIVKEDVVEVNAPSRAQWLTTLLLTKVIKSFSWLMATSPPRGEAKALADAYAALILRDIALIWLIYSHTTTVWDNHSIRTKAHFHNQCNENSSWNMYVKKQQQKLSKLCDSCKTFGVNFSLRIHVL